MKKTLAAIFGVLFLMLISSALTRAVERVDIDIGIEYSIAPAEVAPVVIIDQASLQMADYDLMASPALVGYVEECPVYFIDSATTLKSQINSNFDRGKTARNWHSRWKFRRDIGEKDNPFGG